MTRNERPIYLDHNATTPPDPRVVERVRWALETGWGNPSSAHAAGLAARDAIQNARDEAARLFGVDSSQIVFTSGGTEADFLALWSAWHGRSAGRTRIVVSAIEHPSVLEAARTLSAYGAEVVECAVDRRGRIRLDALAGLCTGQTAAVAAMLANNEVGTVEPMAEVVSIARAAGALVVCDAVQAAGKIRVRLDEVGADYLAASAHKLYGPKGVGCLVVRRGAPLRPWLRGSGQEAGARSGTENVPGIVGFGEACALAREHLEAPAGIAELRDRLEALVVAAGEIEVAGDPDNRLPNTAGILLRGVDARSLLVRLSRRGVAVSTGSACHARQAEPSHVLKAMGVPRDLGLGFLRISTGRTTTEEEIERAAAIIREEIERLRSPRAGRGKLSAPRA